jgi:hypothetical protein
MPLQYLGNKFTNTNVKLKSRRMRWAGHVARVGNKTAYSILMGKPDRERPLEDQGAGGWTMLKWILER